jgi:hypothetical protein
MGTTSTHACTIERSTPSYSYNGGVAGVSGGYSNSSGIGPVIKQSDCGSSRCPTSAQHSQSGGLPYILRPNNR